MATGATGASGERSVAEAALARLRDNAFYVLEIDTACSRLDMERQGQKLLAMLELGLSAAARYATPVGPGERDADKVRQAMAKLRDPDKRLEEELWARLDARARSEGERHEEKRDEHAEKRDEDDDLGLKDLADLPRAARADRPWADALAAFGWRRR